MKLIFAVFVLYYSIYIYPILTGKRRWQCALDASRIYSMIKCFVAKIGYSD